jgi:hypothetical protein
MKVFSSRMGPLLRETLERVVFTALIFLVAWGLARLRDFMAANGAPPWLVTGTDWISIMVFVTDAIVMAVTCVTVVVEVILDAIGRFR